MITKKTRDQACLLASVVASNYDAYEELLFGDVIDALGVSAKATRLLDDCLEAFAMWTPTNGYEHNMRNFAEAEAMLRSGWVPKAENCQLG